MTTTTRIFVMYGQGGFLTSLGMVALARMIRTKFGDISTICTEHSWYSQQEVYNKVMAQSMTTRIILIGYSLGANSVVTVAAAAKRSIELMVCYDPSWLSPQSRKVGWNVKRCVLYHGSGFSLLGHAMLTGPTVEVFDAADIHELADFDQRLHDMTLAAVGKIVSA